MVDLLVFFENHDDSSCVEVVGRQETLNRLVANGCRTIALEIPKGETYESFRIGLIKSCIGGVREIGMILNRVSETFTNKNFDKSRFNSKQAEQIYFFEKILQVHNVSRDKTKVDFNKDNIMNMLTNGYFSSLCKRKLLTEQEKVTFRLFYRCQERLKLFEKIHQFNIENNETIEIVGFDVDKSIMENDRKLGIVENIFNLAKEKNALVIIGFGHFSDIYTVGCKLSKMDEPKSVRAFSIYSKAILKQKGGGKTTFEYYQEALSKLPLPRDKERYELVYCFIPIEKFSSNHLTLETSENENKKIETMFSMFRNPKRSVLVCSTAPGYKPML